MLNNELSVAKVRFVSAENELSEVEIILAILNEIVRKKVRANVGRPRGDNLRLGGLVQVVALHGDLRPGANVLLPSGFH